MSLVVGWGGGYNVRRMANSDAQQSTEAPFIAGTSTFTLGGGGVTEAGLDATEVIKQYVGLLQRQAAKHGRKQPTVEVNEAVGMWAFAYEKLRNSVENREESILLRGAIRRILKRRLSPLWNYESTASALVRELIWARYLKNETVPQHSVDEIEVLLTKYSTLRQAVVGLPQSEEWQDWILGIAACDIERILVDRTASYALAEVMFQWLQKKLVIEDLAEEDKEIQLYLAIHRSLLKSDKTLLTYHLFNIAVDNWQTATGEEALLVARELPSIRRTIDSQLNFSLSQELVRVVKKQVPAFLILDDIVDENPELALSNLTQPDSLKRKVEQFCGQRYAAIDKRIRTAIIRSVIYIFITKVGIALLLEVPFDRYFYGQVHWAQLWFNVLAPPLFMAVMGMSIAKPSPKNTVAIEEQLQQIVVGKVEPEKVVLQPRKSSSGSWLSGIFGFISLATFMAVAWVLWQFEFTLLGIGLFLFFFCVVVFFTYRIRQIAREMTVVRQKENFIEGITTVITLPFLALGYRLSAEFGKINVLTFVLDVLLEAPFKFILDLAESWVNFVRVKREEVVERHDY